AHHTTPWSAGGLTDLDGLALLCRRHHVMVHEGRLRLVRDPSRSGPHQPRFQALDPEGRPVEARWPARPEHLAFAPGTETAPAGPPCPNICCSPAARRRRGRVARRARNARRAPVRRDPAVPTRTPRGSPPPPAGTASGSPTAWTPCSRASSTSRPEATC